MLKRICDIFSGVAVTLFSGFFLLYDLIPHLSHEISGVPLYENILPFEPAWVTIMISGFPLLYSAIYRIIFNQGISKISSALLITIAMFAAITIGDLFAAGEVAWIMAVGGILEDKTTQRAKKGIKKLISLVPVKARRLINDAEEIIPVERLTVKDILRILPGETIPADGTIIRGNTSVDQNIITGESLPVDKSAGDDVFCGTINCFGTIDIQTNKVNKESSLQKLIQLIEKTENEKAPIARIADTAASFLVPTALIIAILTGIITQDITRAVTVLVVFCPCALVLATPTAIMAAIGQAAQNGVIIKSGEALEKMAKINIAAFDKTGTLTYGKLKVSDVIPFKNNIPHEELLSLTAAAEAKSEHPLAQAITASARKQKITISESDNFKMFPGKGIYAQVNNKNIFCGNDPFLAEHNIYLSPREQQYLDELRFQGKATIITAADDNCLGIIALSDELRPESIQVVSALQTSGTETVLLTGDNQKTADFFAKKMGITQIKAGLLPEEKVNNILSLQKDGNSICMIGDGVNDAPAMKTANVGIAMGNLGSDITVNTADIVLINDDITKLTYLKRLATATVQTIKLSISLSMLINLLAIILSITGYLTPTSGALIHNAGSCFVILIAAFLYDRKI